MSGFLEIRDDEIDVDEIMQKIQENINKRKAGGAYQDSVISKLHEKTTVHSFERPNLDPQLDLEYLLDNWDIKNDTYSINSHRPFMGKILISGRRIVHGEVKRYVEPVNFLQSEFNGRVADFSNAIYQNYMHTKEEIIDLRSEVAELRAEMKRMSDLVSGMCSDRTASSLKEGLTQNPVGTEEADKELENKHWMKVVSEGYSSKEDNNSSTSGDVDGESMNYFLFSEEIGRAWTGEGGPCVNEPNVFDDSKAIFRGCKNVLDIGCGTGTFLKALKEEDIEGYGVDTDEDYVLLCERNGFKVLRDDAISHLQSLEPKSLDGVFMSQLVEHLSSDELLRILKLCYEKMQFETYIVITTPNILSVLVSANLFYLDPTHRSHVHPEVMKFMLRSCGYRDIQERYYQPVSEDIKLKRIGSVELADKESGVGLSEEITELLNSNIDKLNNLLFGFRDYCVIAKK
ncbi:MAG: methionine biosynthesis protein MetW [Methanolobus sp.]|nr:methionine biosynthesis protein MetW [Methanolobus sp.]